MGTKSDQTRVLFFPLMATGHMLPTLDMAKLFAARGVETTVITTTNNADVFEKPIEKMKSSGIEIGLKIVRFLGKEVGLPEGLENLDSVNSVEIHRKFFSALDLLKEPIDQILQEMRPHGFVSDLFFPWTVDVAAKFGIPRLVFHGTSFFSMCAAESVALHEPHFKVGSDSELFELPGLPDTIKLTRLQLADNIRTKMDNGFTKLLDRAHESEKKSFGMLVNSFYKLEPGYVDHYRKVLGRKAWHIGPVSLCNKKIEEKIGRGKSYSITEDDCLKWLDSKEPNSVVYVCFGTTTKFSDAQLCEIAIGIESSGQKFIWVVKKEKRDGEELEEDWLPEGFEKRNEKKGMIIRGWAPQVMILEHKSVGGFVTHCGWNSALEGISAGLPLVTWPIFAEQFFNEKLITDVLRIGVGVGAQKWVRLVGDYIKSDAIERAVREIMVGKKAEEMRNRAMVIGELAKKAVEDGGSSYCDLGNLIEDLRNFSCSDKPQLCS